MGVADVASLINTMSNMLLDKKTTKLSSVPQNVLDQFNQVFSSISPQLTGNVVSESDIQGLINNILNEGNRAFATTRQNFGKLGGYNSSTLSMLENDARSKAISQSIGQMVAAKQGNTAAQQAAAQLLTQNANAQANATKVETDKTAAPLGSLAGPLAAYVAYKAIMGDSGKVAPIIEAGRKAPAAASTGGVEKGTTSGTAKTVTSSGTSPVSAASAASKLPNALDYLFQGGPLTSLQMTNTLGDLSALGNVSTSLSGLDTAASLSSSIVPSLKMSDTLSSLGGISGAANAASGIKTAAEAGSIFPSVSLGNSTLFSDTLGLGADVGGALDSVLNVFNPSVNIPGLGPTGIPLLAGLNNFSQGNIAQGVGDIGATVALNAIPVVGPFLSLASGLTSNGVLDDWLGIDGCFITTAIMKVMADKFDDNGYELTVLRNFRDDYMAADPERAKFVKQYYETAPRIVELINDRHNADDIYKFMYKFFILPAIGAIEADDNETAFDIYNRLYDFASKLAENQAADIAS